MASSKNKNSQGIKAPKNDDKIISWGRFWTELWSLLRPFKKLFLLVFVMAIFTALLDLVKPYILKWLIDGLTNFNSSDLKNLLKLIALYILTDQFRSLVQYFNDRRILLLLVKVEYFLGMKSQEKLLDLSLGYHEKENTGNKIVKIERGADKISKFIENVSWEMMPTLVQLVITLPALFWAEWRIGLSFLIFAPAFLITTYWANKKMYPIRKEIYKDYEVASGKMGQAIININAVQSFVQEKEELDGFDKIKSHIRDNDNKQWSWMMKMALGRNLIADIGRGVVLLLGVYFVAKGVISVGSLIFAFTLSEKAYSSLYRLTRFYDRMEEGREGVNRLLALFNAQSEVVDNPKGYKPKTIEGEIEFKNVSFAYSDNSRSAINNLNLKINSGCVTALVGPSGGGKTTLARLIYRHYDPKSGQVLLDGRDLRDYRLREFRRFLAIVPQEVEIFDLSVRDNIAYAKPGASFKEIEAAARIANAEEFIQRLEDKYDTMVGERGIKLSGGQRQRIGIARAILANPRILIFDEATSNLDSQSEALIRDAMDKISRQRTMIIIAHRLSTIKKADKIVVLENGCIVEEGSHLELSRVNGGLYAKLLKLQELGEIS
jgi:ABC-type multidrug transport system fused ATPase/permease subunit